MVITDLKKLIEKRMPESPLKIMQKENGIYLTQDDDLSGEKIGDDLLQARAWVVDEIKIQESKLRFMHVPEKAAAAAKIFFSAAAVRITDKGDVYLTEENDETELDRQKYLQLALLNI
ncbi:hypothetical protein KAU11_12375 [Candidatus Babeliales bacterium]|nr:hypothetical protein [Candidatus Babeliales bacterium]